MCPRFAVLDIDEQLKSAFYDFVEEKHGRKYGNITKELENFIKIGLALENFRDFPTKISFLTGPTGLQVEKSQTHKKFTKRQKALLLEFEDRFLEVNEIPNREISKLIKETLKVI